VVRPAGVHVGLPGMRADESATAARTAALLTMRLGTSGAVRSWPRPSPSGTPHAGERRPFSRRGSRPDRAHRSNACSTRGVTAVPWPAECRLHHPWGPGVVTITWEPCDCPAARAARGAYLKVRCNAPGLRGDLVVSSQPAGTAAARSPRRPSPLVTAVSASQAPVSLERLCHGSPW